MNLHQQESQAYQHEIDTVSADLVRRGECSPWDAIQRAHEIVQRRRRMNSRNDALEGVPLMPQSPHRVLIAHLRDLVAATQPRPVGGQQVSPPVALSSPQVIKFIQRELVPLLDLYDRQCGNPPNDGGNYFDDFIDGNGR